MDGAPIAQARPDGEYAVQVFATRLRQQADDMRARLEEKGYRTYVDESGGGRSPLYRVRVGPFAGRQEAEIVMERLRQEEAVSGFVTRLGDTPRQ